LPNHYLIFTLSSELLANKVVIKIFQNYINNPGKQYLYND